MGSLTPIEFRRLKSSADILDNPAEQIAYQHTVFCQTCLPYKNPGKVRVWERRQGAVILRVEAGSVHEPQMSHYIDVGLPYGSSPRLIMAHLNREALLTGSPCIDVGKSLTAFIKRIINRASPNSRDIIRFKDQLTRFAAATVRMSVNLPDDRAYQVNTHIIEVMTLWLEKNDKQRILWPEVVELSSRYFESLTAHAVPLDERAIGALANSPMALDVYAWLVQRLCRVKQGKPQFIPWVALKEQFGQGFIHMFRFKAQFRDILMEVKAQYPAAKFDLDERGMTLAASLPPVSSRLRLTVDT